MTENELRNIFVRQLHKQGITEIEIEIRAPGGSRKADLIYVDENQELNVVEFKLRINEKLYRQANTWQSFCKNTWIAVEKIIKKEQLNQYIDQGIGVLEYKKEKNELEIIFSPKLYKSGGWFAGHLVHYLHPVFFRARNQKDCIEKGITNFAFRCKDCNSRVTHRSTRYLQLKRDELGLMRAAQYCYKCGEKIKKIVEKNSK